jgi:hypothetical protein
MELGNLQEEKEKQLVPTGNHLVDISNQMIDISNHLDYPGIK